MIGETIHADTIVTKVASLTQNFSTNTCEGVGEKGSPPHLGATDPSAWAKNLIPRPMDDPMTHQDEQVPRRDLGTWFQSLPLFRNSPGGGLDQGSRFGHLPSPSNGQARDASPGPVGMSDHRKESCRKDAAIERNLRRSFVPAVVAARVKSKGVKDLFCP